MDGALAGLTTLPRLIGAAGFAAAAVAYAFVALLVLMTHSGARQADWLVGALLASVLWGALSLAAVWSGSVSWAGAVTLDAIHAAAWVLFLAAVLAASTESKAAMRLGRLVVIATLALTAAVLAGSWLGAGSSAGLLGGSAVLVAMLGLPILGLLALEQVFRNSSFSQHAFLRPLSLAMGIVFALDVFVYSQAVLFGRIDPDLWLLRGVANAAVAPVILLAVKRQPDWGRELFVSRRLVFYTTGMIGAGFYLLAMGIAGFIIGTHKGAWTAPIQVVFLIVTSLVFLYALFSATVRRSLKVFVTKHFFRDRYDYREEWLRLTDALARGGRGASLAERGLKALAAIIGSPGGELWLARAAGGGFEPWAAWHSSHGLPAAGADDEMLRFLARTHWVVDSEEYREDPEKYANAFGRDCPWIASPSIIVPLIHEDKLVGFVRLDRPALLGQLSFKDHDLLKTAGRQVAVFLAQQRAEQALSETQQFEAFSKLTAFLMHDLKNLIAQQELVVGNAQRFRHRPEFIDDAMQTIEASVARMKRLLERLQGAAGRERTSRVDLGRLLEDICASCADRLPAPHLTAAAAASVAMDKDKLSMMVTHAIRNAQDATAPDGRIDVRLGREDGLAVIDVQDTGTGMDAQFVRDKLFKPFFSTKGAQGMGIGAYQIRETLQSAGGHVEVNSEPGKGTRLRLAIPIDEPAADSARQAAVS